MLYDFLNNESELTRFAENVLPDVEANECFLLLLCARKKYLTQEEKAQVVLGEAASLRRVIVSDRSQLLHKVKELCVPRDLYKTRDGRPIPNHAFVVYITPNPRSYKKAAVRIVTELVEGLAEGRPLRLESLVKTQIHRAVSRKIYLDLDIDPGAGDDWRSILVRIKAILGATPTHVVQTRNGAHVLVKTQALDKIVKQTFYKQLQQLSAEMAGLVEIRSDAMVPVPGTIQGGATPFLLCG